MPSLKPNAHLQSLEMMRAAAACLIVCYHACLFAERILGATPLLGWYHGLQLGVDSFLCSAALFCSGATSRILAIPSARVPTCGDA